MLVLAGTPTLRHPQGEDQLGAGDLVCLPEGPAGAHRLLNRGESVVRALFLSTTGLPANICYPDGGHWLIRNGLGRDEVVVARPAQSGRAQRIREWQGDFLDALTRRRALPTRGR